MHERDVLFLESIFKKYYYDSISGMPTPDSILKREFGYQKFATTGMIRHIRFADAAEMRVRILREAPSDVYCSNAYYGFPEMEMSQKDWQGADLIFDIDAKDLQLSCRSGHELDVCSGCGRATPCIAANTKETADVICDCSNKETRQLRRKSLPCKKCIDASKSQVRRLAGLLCDDLAIPRDHIMVYFSGNEGFHLHITHDNAYKALDARARASLAEYITLKGVLPESVGVHKGVPINKNEIASITDAGWRGRLAKVMFGSASGRDRILSDIAKTPDPYSEIQRLLYDAAGTIGIRIDPGVTMDVHRVFRMPYTLNGKSGMLKMSCALDALDSFDPHMSAVVLDGQSAMTIESDCPLKFKLGGRRAGPYNRGERVEVPAYEAAYLICKGLAKLPDSL